MLVRPEISALDSPRRDSLSWLYASIFAPVRMFVGIGAFDSFGRSLNAIFENRPPWPSTMYVAGLIMFDWGIPAFWEGFCWSLSPVKGLGMDSS
jgi:hypothetical protein